MEDIFVMVGEAMGGGVGRIGVVAGDVIEGAGRVGGRGEVGSNTWCGWLGKTVEEVGFGRVLVMERVNMCNVEKRTQWKKRKKQ